MLTPANGISSVETVSIKTVGTLTLLIPSTQVLVSDVMHEKREWRVREDDVSDGEEGKSIVL